SPSLTHAAVDTRQPSVLPTRRAADLPRETGTGSPAEAGVGSEEVAELTVQLEARRRPPERIGAVEAVRPVDAARADRHRLGVRRSEEHTSELQSRFDLVCRLLLEKKK